MRSARGAISGADEMDCFKKTRPWLMTISRRRNRQAAGRRAPFHRGAAGGEGRRGGRVDGGGVVIPIVSPRPRHGTTRHACNTAVIRMQSRRN